MFKDFGLAAQQRRRDLKTVTRLFLRACRQPLNSMMAQTLLEWPEGAIRKLVQVDFR